MDNIRLWEVVEIRGDLSGYGIVVDISTKHPLWDDFITVKFPSKSSECFSPDRVFKIRNPITKFFQTRKFNKLFEFQCPKDNKTCKTSATGH